MFVGWFKGMWNYLRYVEFGLNIYINKKKLK
jgi:hypothetical protein